MRGMRSQGVHTDSMNNLTKNELILLKELVREQIIRYDHATAAPIYKSALKRLHTKLSQLVVE